MPQGRPEKSSNFRPVPKAAKVMKIGSKGTQNHEKMDPGIIRIPTSARIDFCNTSLAKFLVLQSQTSKSRPKNHQKKKPGNKHEEIHFFIQGTQKTFKTGSLNSQQIN